MITFHRGEKDGLTLACNRGDIEGSKRSLGSHLM